MRNRELWNLGTLEPWKVPEMARDLLPGVSMRVDVER